MHTLASLTRRRFLASLAGVSGGALLASCAPKPAPTTSPTEAPEAAEKPIEVAQPAPKAAAEIHFLCRADIKPAYGTQESIDEWNANNESQVILDEPAAGAPVDVKVQAAQAAGDLVWDGFSVVEAPNQTVPWQRRGLLQPMDDYISASTVANADKVVPSIIPSIRESVSIQGKIHGIPGNVGSIQLAWFTEPLKAIGIEEQPETWDEVYEAAVKLKETSPELVPFGSAGGPICDLYSIIWGSMENPFDDDDLVDIRSEESIWGLRWMRKMIEEGLMYDVPNTGLEQWLKGGWAMITSYDVAGTMAQNVFGMEAVGNGIALRRFAGKPMAGTPFWINSSVLFNKAQNPQGMVDFFLWWFGPDNDISGKQIAEVAAKPCYTYTYEEFVQGRPEYEWEQEGIDLVAQSAWFRENTVQPTERSITQQYLDRVYDLGLTFEPEAWMDECYQEIQDEIAKMR